MPEWGSPMTPEDMLAREFGTIPEVIRLHAEVRPAHPALVQDERRLGYRALDRLMDRIAAGLRRDGLVPGDTIAICAGTSLEYAAAFLGALRAGAAVAPLSPSSSPASLLAMLRDSGARHFFIDAATNAALGGGIPGPVGRISLDGSQAGTPLLAWLAPEGTKFEPAAADPDAPFNIIYSSGTTGMPKGIVQPNRMRWTHVSRGVLYGYGPEAISIISTPLYSNTTLVSFFPTVACGGTAVLMAKFDPGAFLALAEKRKATHAILVPVQYKRLMEHPDFGRYDLSHFRMKFCTSAPFPAVLKADILKRWPGGLIEYYGLTEGGGTCVLAAHEFPGKLHTVGKPIAGHDIRLICEDGREAATGEAGEVVGHSPGMMKGYHNRPELTADTEWRDAEGKRFIRTGDIGRFDADGFLTLMGRRKDMIISGGFNIYPSDLEAVLAQHEAVAEAAVVGVVSERWGETPVAFVVLKPDSRTSAEALREWANARLGKVQRIAEVRLQHELPRSTIGKVLKRELRERYAAA
jgi:acyl-CoA synthetase (AMP-forming)/AMP-acid ligase II